MTTYPASVLRFFDDPPPQTRLGTCLGCGEAIYFDNAKPVEYCRPGSYESQESIVCRDTADKCEALVVERLGVELA